LFAKQCFTNFNCDETPKPTQATLNICWFMIDGRPKIKITYTRFNLLMEFLGWLTSVRGAAGLPFWDPVPIT